MISIDKFSGEAVGGSDKFKSSMEFSRKCANCHLEYDKNPVNILFLFRLELDDVPKRQRR
jgi:hypothetical protein